MDFIPFICRPSSTVILRGLIPHQLNWVLFFKKIKSSSEIDSLFFRGLDFFRRLYFLVLTIL